jgi:putative transposase
MPDVALVEAIRRVLIDSPFHGEGYRKVWARLRHQDLRTSKERVRRLMRENGLLAATRTGSPAARATTTARSSRRQSTGCGEPT